MKTRGALFATAMAIALLFAFIPASSPQSQLILPQTANCTKTGTSRDNVMSGTKRRDVICALGGADYIHGKNGHDVVRAGSGRDALIGGGGRDRLLGNAGNDRLFAVDGRGGDVLHGGPGPDRCFIDTGDHIRGGCERSFLGASIQSSNSMSNAFGGALTLAEELIGEVTPPLPVPGSVTTTTVTVPFPPCTPPPDTLPNPCG